MRVITGMARGRVLSAPDNNDIRPTSDKVKESVFSAINFDLEGAVFLDLFAGTGQMGIEAISRGASQAIFVDASAKAIELVRKNLDVTGFFKLSQLVNMTAEAFLKNTKNVFDIVYIDPPFDKVDINELLVLAVAKMSNQGIILVESSLDTQLGAQFGGFEIAKVYKYGKVKVTSYKQKERDI